MSCANPMDAAVLADYWLGALAGAEEENVELHLLGNRADGNRLHTLVAQVPAPLRVTARPCGLPVPSTNARSWSTSAFRPPVGSAVRSECGFTAPRRRSFRCIPLPHRPGAGSR